MLDFVSVVIGAVCVGVPFGFFVVWVAARARLRDEQLERLNQELRWRFKA